MRDITTQTDHEKGLINLITLSVKRFFTEDDFRLFEIIAKKSVRIVDNNLIINGQDESTEGFLPVLENFIAGVLGSHSQLIVQPESSQSNGVSAP